MSDNNFRLIPDLEFINEFVKCYGLKNVDDSKMFSKADLAKMGTADNILKNKIGDLCIYYRTHKVQAFLIKFNEGTCLTILRHFLKTMGKMLMKKESVIGRKKIIQYYIHNKVHDTVSINYKTNKMISFD